MTSKKQPKTPKSPAIQKEPESRAVRKRVPLGMASLQFIVPYELEDTINEYVYNYPLDDNMSLPSFLRAGYEIVLDESKNRYEISAGAHNHVLVRIKAKYAKEDEDADHARIAERNYKV
jgi:hypothetical protein